MTKVTSPSEKQSCDFGLLISLEPEFNNLKVNDRKSLSTTCYFTYCPDINFHHLHPNIYGPSSLSEVTKLGGGGSGVTVFSGNLKKGDDAGVEEELIMKHGGYKDTQELWALASIYHQLHGDGYAGSKARGREENMSFFLHDFKKRIPKFGMIYISPNHLKHLDMWKFIRSHFKQKTQNKKRQSMNMGLLAQGPTLVSLRKSLERVHRKSTLSASTSTQRAIILHQIPEDEIHVEVCHQSFDFYLPKGTLTALENNSEIDEDEDGCDTRISSFQYGEKGRGYETFHTLLNDHIIPLQKSYGWKFTLGQTAIGNENLDPPKIGSVHLIEGTLKSTLLQTFITEFIKSVIDLQHLTFESEKYILKQLQAEYEKQEMHYRSTEFTISKEMNQFGGGAFIKNYHPENGRFKNLYAWGDNFRLNSNSPSTDLILTEEEETPAHYLGMILNPKVRLGKVIKNDSRTKDCFCIFHSLYKQKKTKTPPWKKILHYALFEVKSQGATQRFWNGGLTDAGLHNVFINEKDLWFFDLGESSLQSLPGLLTKVLFSFFHALGMEDDGKGGYVNRFDVQSLQDSKKSSDVGKVKLTEETLNLFDVASEAFEKTLNEFILRLFDGEDKMRWLLLQYMTLQLLSDASFCVERWSIKGGGRSRENNHQKGIEKWLWRALWDLYVATLINTKESLRRFKVI